MEFPQNVCHFVQKFCSYKNTRWSMEFVFDMFNNILMKFGIIKINFPNKYK